MSIQKVQTNSTYGYTQNFQRVQTRIPSEANEHTKGADQFDVWAYTEFPTCIETLLAKMKRRHESPQTAVRAAHREPSEVVHIFRATDTLGASKVVAVSGETASAIPYLKMMLELTAAAQAY